MENNKQYIYDAIYSTLKQKIESGFFKYGDYLPSEAQLCQQFFASRITIQHALRMLSEQGYIERKTKTGSRVIYSFAAVPERSVYFISALNSYATFLQSLKDSLNKSGIGLIEKYFQNDENLQKKYINECVESKALGFVILPTTKFSASEQLINLERKKYPFIVYDTCPLYPQYSTVFPDRLTNVKSAFEYLVKTGHKNIGYFSMLSRYSKTMHLGRLGFSQAADSAGLSHCKKNVFEIKTDTARIFQNHEFMMMAKSIFKNLNGMTAIICGNDHLAYNLITHAEKSFIDVPKDLSIIGHDDYYGENPPYMPLTTIKHNFKLAGECCANALIAKINGKADYRTETAVPGELVVRSTTRKLN